jgi:hypothetical protein
MRKNIKIPRYTKNWDTHRKNYLSSEVRNVHAVYAEDVSVVRNRMSVHMKDISEVCMSVNVKDISEVCMSVHVKDISVVSMSVYVKDISEVCMSFHVKDVSVQYCACLSM